MCNKNHWHSMIIRDSPKGFGAFRGAVIDGKGGSGSQSPFQGLSKQKLGRALLACPYAIATGVSSSLRGYFGALQAF
jgi:hypothetical protein